MATLAHLELTDGVTSIDLLRGPVYLKDYRPGYPQLKGDGIWMDNSMATGRKLVDRRFGNVDDALTLAISTPNQDDTITRTGDLLRLLEKARDFTASSWQSDPVWIKRQAGCETNPTFALVYDYRIPELANPFAAPFAAATELATLDEFSLGLEHSIWLSEPPGTGACVAASAYQTGEQNDAWTQLASPAGANDIEALVQSGTGRIFGADTGRIIYSDDDGANWAVSTALPVGQCECLLMTTTGRILCGEDGGIWRTDNDGVAWAFSVEAFTEVHALIQLAGGRILASDDNGAASQIWKSDDNGDTWQVLAATPSAVNTFTQLGADASHPLRILAGRTGVIQASDDNGLTWTVIAFNIDITQLFLALYTTSGGRILGNAVGGGGADNYIRRSDDDGVTWTIVVSGLGSGPYGFLEITGGRILAVAGGGSQQKSDDGGLTWTGVSDFGHTLNCIMESTTGRVLSSSDDHIGMYGPIVEMTMGATASCAGIQFVGNKANTANLTHVYVAAGGGVAFGINLLPCIFPVTLLPVGAVHDDAIYFGNSSSDPFESIVFDIDHVLTATVGVDIIWEYSDGAAGWPALTVTDGTDPVGAGVFLNGGVVSVHWEPPAGWVEEDPGMGVTGLWVRARVDDLHGGAMTPPTQQNRNIYTVTWPDIDVASDQVAGDIPALARVKLRNRSDNDGTSNPKLWTNRIVAGLRSYTRGTTFTAYLNCSTEQNPPGVTYADTVDVTTPPDVTGITGIRATYTAAAGHTTFADQVTFTLAPTVARDYYGTFHAFLRAGLAAGASSDIHARLQVRTGSGGVSLTTADDYLKNTADFEVLDLGRVSIPASGLLSYDDLGDETVLALQFRNDSGVARTVYLHDLILIPVDEWAVDAVDYANSADSIVGHQSYTPHLLDVDSLTYQKTDVRCPVRTADADAYVTSIYVPGGGPAVLQANARQRLWVFAMKTSTTGTAYEWLAPPWIAHSVQVWGNARWLGYRGDR